ncbi:MAG: IMP dehydrogenase, partial [Planctomycetes bacterium]|nr:IMP dehydrogenase [Planctomycetota bacterium]
LGAMADGSASRYSQSVDTPTEKFVPEGVEGRVPYRGLLADFVYQLVGGLKSGMGYCGTATIDDLRLGARFCSVSAAGVAESHAHDITMTRESPNYAP